MLHAGVLHMAQTAITLTTCFLLLPVVLCLLYFRVSGVDLVPQERGAKLPLQLHGPVPCARQLCGAFHLCGLSAAILWGLHFPHWLPVHDALGPGVGPGTLRQGQSTSVKSNNFSLPWCAFMSNANAKHHCKANPLTLPVLCNNVQCCSCFGVAHLYFCIQWFLLLTKR